MSVSALQSRAVALVSRPLFWGVFVALGLGIPIANQLRHPAPAPLAVLGTLADFRLTDQDGRAFGSVDLRGYVWVAGFIFTRCPTICPAITAQMARIQKRARGIENGFRLVSFSVDPAWDTPARLGDYARKYRVSPRMWKLLTGDLAAMQQTVVDGLKIAMGAPAAGETDFASVFHGTHFVLVDQAMRIRGYFDSSDPQVEDKLLASAAMLINRGE